MATDGSGAASVGTADGGITVGLQAAAKNKAVATTFIRQAVIDGLDFMYALLDTLVAESALQGKPLGVRFEPFSPNLEIRHSFVYCLPEAWRMVLNL